MRRINRVGLRAPLIATACLLACIVSPTSLGACSHGESDEDRIERFISEVTGQVDDALIDRALSYLELSAFPLDVRVPSLSGVFDDSRAFELTKLFREGMQRRFRGSELKVRSKKIEIEQGRAEVKLVLVTRYGPLRAELSLRKLGEDFKVSRVHVDR